jgi:hypothetical protein
MTFIGQADYRRHTDCRVDQGAKGRGNCGALSKMFLGFASMPMSAMGRGPPLAAQAHLPPQDRMPTRDSTSCVAGFWEIIEPSM